jgi:hypothetical protein
MAARPHQCEEPRPLRGFFFFKAATLVHSAACSIRHRPCTRPSNDITTASEKTMSLLPLVRPRRLDFRAIGAAGLTALALALPCVPALAFQPSPVQPDESNLDNHQTYRNRDGATVHAPAHSLSGKAPEGATARCRDGTYSFSRHRSGTCSRHGGVASWL